MEKVFWLKKWEENQIGFHSDKVNDLLLAHIDKFNLQKNSTIFVPLCGKSIDLIYLAKLGHRVFGLELSEKAVEAFFAENNLSFEKKIDGAYKRFSCTELEIELIQGDFFELSRDIIGPLDFIYDRAALIALPSDMRVRYSKIMGEITQKAAQILFISTEYDHPEIIGPPFSVKESEVNNLYKDNFEIIVLNRLDKELENPRFQEAGVKNPARVVYKLIRK